MSDASNGSGGMNLRTTNVNELIQTVGMQALAQHTPTPMAPPTTAPTEKKPLKN
jgi:hypothetical protein